MSAPSVPLIKIYPKAANGQITFFWSPPVSGAPLTQYNLSDGTTTTTVSASATTYTVTGLTNGTSYTYTLSATNASGTGPTATFRTVQPGTISQPPWAAGSAYVDPNTILTVWDQPSAVAASSVKWNVLRNPTRTQKYQAYPTSDWQTFTGTFSPFTDYRFGLHAVNDAGYSLRAPADVSGAPVILSATIDTNARAWTGIAMSADGSFVVAVVNNGFIYTSTNWGGTWTQRDSSRAWTCVACSSTGQYCVAAVGGGSDYVYVSTDYGATWTQSTSSGTRDWASVAISANGGVILANPYGSGVSRSTNYGSSWTIISANPRPGFNLFLAISGNGRYALISNNNSDPIKYSTNGGASFTTSSYTQLNRGYFAISFDGTAMYGGGQNTQIVKSTDYGASFSVLTNSPTKTWTGLACSYDGKLVYGVETGGLLWYSVDSGATWSSLTFSSGNQPTGVAVTSDGMQMVSCVNARPSAGITRFCIPRYFACAQRFNSYYTATNANYIKSLNRFVGNSDLSICIGWGAGATSNKPHITRDYGKTWSVIADLSNANIQPRRFAMSADGTKMYVASTTIGKEFYRSMDSGQTWSYTDVSGASTSLINGVACSADGSFVYAFRSTSLNVNLVVYKSTDSGATFTQKTMSFTMSNESTQNFATACSSSGQYILGSNLGNQLIPVLSTDYGETFTQLSTLISGDYGTAMSADGSIMVLAGNSTTGRFYISRNYGSSWVSIVFPGISINNFGATMSANGGRIVAYAGVGATIGLALSLDGGITWYIHPFPQPANSLAAITSINNQQPVLSADGTKIFFSALGTPQGTTGRAIFGYTGE